MPYTEFRKSYNGIKVVIPPVDFSSLTRDEAVSTAKRLRAYVAGFVCRHRQITREAFDARLSQTHSGNQHEREYRAAMTLIDVHVEIWTPTSSA